MYKVLKEVLEDHQTGNSTESAVTWLLGKTCPQVFPKCLSIRFFWGWAKASISGRCRDAGAKQLLAKQLAGVNANPQELMNLQTGAIRSKKAKKEKSPQEESMAEMKKLNKKFFVCKV